MPLTGLVAVLLVESVSVVCVLDTAKETFCSTFQKLSVTFGNSVE